MCYLDEPSQITQDPGEFIFYIDTATTLSVGSEVNTIAINPLIMNTISDPTAAQCEFSIVLDSLYSGSIDYTDS